MTVFTLTVNLWLTQRRCHTSKMGTNCVNYGITMTEIPTSTHTVCSRFYIHTRHQWKCCHQSPNIAATGMQSIISHSARSHVVRFN